MSYFQKYVSFQPCHSPVFSILDILIRRPYLLPTIHNPNNQPPTTTWDPDSKCPCTTHFHVPAYGLANSTEGPIFGNSTRPKGSYDQAANPTWRRKQIELENLIKTLYLILISFVSDKSGNNQCYLKKNNQAH